MKFKDEIIFTCGLIHRIAYSGFGFLCPVEISSTEEINCPLHGDKCTNKKK